MTDVLLTSLRDAIQDDIGKRGLRADPNENLVNAWPDDFAQACYSVARQPNASIGVITGFLIAHAQPPCCETDGPLGAMLLARACHALGIHVSFFTDAYCTRALAAGLRACKLEGSFPIVVIPTTELNHATFAKEIWPRYCSQRGLTHLVALERVGPSHTVESIRKQAGADEALAAQFLRDVPLNHHDRCHTMKGRDITEHTAPLHRLIEAAAQGRPRVATIGIGDGGNEIGMGKIRWDVIRRNIPGGATIACRVSVDHLIVTGVSNWGAYALAAGVAALRKTFRILDLFDPATERELLRIMVADGPLVDGVTGRQTISVDGLSFEQYMGPMLRIRQLLESSQ